MRHLPLLFILCLAAGCQQSGLTVQPVTGKVMYHGEPVANAVIGFYPQESSGYVAAGTTDESGTFTLNIPGAQTSGALAGEYRVTAAKEIAVDGMGKPIPDGAELETRPKMKSVLPAKYGKSENTPLTAAVVKGKNNFLFELED
jgi:hypothetical protein